MFMDNNWLKLKDTRKLNSSLLPTKLCCVNEAKSLPAVIKRISIKDSLRHGELLIYFSETSIG